MRLNRFGKFAPAVVALWLMSAGVSFADQPVARILGDAVVPPGGRVTLTGMDAVSDDTIQWFLQPGAPAVVSGQVFDWRINEKEVKAGALYFIPNMPLVKGKYVFRQVCVGTKPGATRPTADAALFEVTVTDGTPVPVPDVPPEPKPVDPVPKPVDPPTPKPVEPPIPAEKPRILLLWDSSKGITQEHVNALRSAAVWDYLKSHTPADGWRIWNVSGLGGGDSAETPLWRGTWDKIKADPVPVPKVAFFYTTAEPKVFPLPKTEAEILALLKKYGGQ